MQLPAFVRRRGRHADDGSDDDDEDAHGDFAGLGVGGFRRRAQAQAVSSAQARMVFISAGVQGGTIEDAPQSHPEPEPTSAAAEHAPRTPRDGQDEEEDDDEDDEDDEVDIDAEGFSYADMQRILAMELGDQECGDAHAFGSSGSDEDDESDEDDDSDSDGSSSASGEEEEGEEEEEAEEEGGAHARSAALQAHAASPACAAEVAGPAAQTPAARARAAVPQPHPGGGGALSADELLSLLVAQPSLLSLTLRRPAKAELGALAWRAESLDVELVTEGARSVVLTKVGPGPAGGGGRPAARAERSARPQLELGGLDGALCDFKGLGGKKTLPKHLKKQLKAAKRIRAQELDFAAQRRLMHEVLTLSGGLSYGAKKPGAGKRHATAARARSEPRGRRPAGVHYATPERDAAAQLKTTRHLAAIGEENKGHQMLTSMGWAGGALGSAADGLATPLTVDVRKGRRGLGHDTA